MFFYKQRLH